MLPRRARYILPTCLALVALTVTNADHNADTHLRMSLVAVAPDATTHSDLAFWGDHAFIGYYSGDTTSTGGFRIFDISDPANPTLVRDVPCDGPQADPIVWDRNGNGIADLLMLAVDRTMANPNCGAPRAAHDSPAGWEGVRIFTLSDDPANPFATITQVKAVYTDCGAHTMTLWPGEVSEGSLIVYVSSYPLRPGPTCGDTEYLNTANPFDADPGSPANPLHGVIQVIEVPLNDPSAAQEIAQEQISYPSDPDGRLEWCERSLCGLEPAAIGCSSITVHVARRLAAAACGEQAQVWEIDEDGIPDTQNPLFVFDDEISSGGTGDISGAVDFFDSAAFNNRGSVVNFVDQSFGSGCPPVTQWLARPWNPAGGSRNTGRMFFLDAIAGAILNEFQVGDVRPDTSATAYCAAGRGAAVRNSVRDVLITGWYQNGVNVLDFTNPQRLREIAYYDAALSGGIGSAYAYAGPSFHMGRGHPVYAADGVTNNASAQGFVVFKAIFEDIKGLQVDHLNPQTVD